MKCFCRSVEYVIVVMALLVSNVVDAQTQQPDSTESLVPQQPGRSATEDSRKLLGETIQIGKRLKMFSKILQQEREYLVFLPPSYEPNKYLPKSYPVLFLFDGNVQFHAVTGMVEFMGGAGGQIPEMIVIGIPHQNRTKELTPTHTTSDFRKGKSSDQLSDSGGGDDFLAFVTTELLPKIDSDYRTRPFRILFGHSFGGLLAANALVNNSFQGFILADPSLWWDSRYVIRRLETRISSGEISKSNSAAFVSRVSTYKSPDDESTQRGFDNIADSITLFDRQLEKLDFVRKRTRLFPVETHTSVPIQTLYHGLLHIFEGYEPPPELYLSPTKKIEEHFKAVSDKVGIEMRPREQLIDMWGKAFLNYDEDFRKYAVPLFEFNVAKYPSSPNAHVSLATAYAKIGNLEKSRQSYQNALQLDPENDEAKKGLEKSLQE